VSGPPAARVVIADRRDAAVKADRRDAAVKADRRDAAVKADRSVFFTSDRVAARATCRVGFGFPHTAALVRIRLAASLTDYLARRDPAAIPVPGGQHLGRATSAASSASTSGTTTRRCPVRATSKWPGRTPAGCRVRPGHHGERVDGRARDAIECR
jgi:hypothetical protein